MTTEELEAVYLINLYRSYSKAAEVAGTYISTLSQRVSSIEKELGGPIFIRSTRKGSVQLTDLGRLIMPRVQKILSLNSDIRYQIDNLSSLERTVLKIGMPAMPEYTRIGSFLAGYSALHPDVELITVIRTADELVRYMINGDIDCCFLISDVVGGNISDIKPLFAGTNYDIARIETSEDMFIYMGKNDPLAEKEELRKEDLFGYRFIFNLWSITHIRWINDRKIPFFSSYGLSEEDYDISFEDYTNETYVMELVSRGFGIVPLAFINGAPFPGTVRKRMADWNGISQMFFICRCSAEGRLAELREGVLKAWGKENK